MGNHAQKCEIKETCWSVLGKLAISKSNSFRANERGRDNKVVCKELHSRKVFVVVG